MCKLCERDKDKFKFLPNMTPGRLITEDRLAVLERDHLAMERLRKDGAYHILMLHSLNIIIGDYGQPSDPTDAILGVSKDIRKSGKVCRCPNCHYPLEDCVCHENPTYY